jgi:hypothetical protein
MKKKSKDTHTHTHTHTHTYLSFDAFVLHGVHITVEWGFYDMAFCVVVRLACYVQRVHVQHIAWDVWEGHVEIDLKLVISREIHVQVVFGVDYHVETELREEQQHDRSHCTQRQDLHTQTENSPCQYRHADTHAHTHTHTGTRWTHRSAYGADFHVIVDLGVRIEAL